MVLMIDNYDSFTYNLVQYFRQLPDTERRKLASDISEEIVWLVSLVENILNMTRINESQLVLRKSEEVIDDVVSEAISHVSRLMKDRRFTVQLPEDVLMVPMDGKLIVRVLINLLENAIRHTTPDSEIKLSVAAVGDFLEITVTDTGNGIDESIRDTLFDRFVTVDKGVADGKRGIGLGLAICKAIVEAHGGTIRAQANVPSGARLVFTLPLETKADNSGESLIGG